MFCITGLKYSPNSYISKRWLDHGALYTPVASSTDTYIAECGIRKQGLVGGWWMGHNLKRYIFVLVSFLFSLCFLVAMDCIISLCHVLCLVSLLKLGKCYGLDWEYPQSLVCSQVGLLSKGDTLEQHVFLQVNLSASEFSSCLCCGKARPGWKRPSLGSVTWKGVSPSPTPLLSLCFLATTAWAAFIC